MKALTSVLVFGALLLFMGESAADAVFSAMELCVKRVIPSLFPSMVLSSMILSLDLLSPLYSRIPTEKYLALPRCASSVLLTGLLCGFPVGAAGCANLVRSGKLTALQGARLCAMSCAVSPAFVIGVVGRFWGREYGVILWLTQILFALLWGLLFPGDISSSDTLPQNNKLPGISQAVSVAISSAASSCLSVLASVTLFGSMAQLLSCHLPAFAPVFSLFLEFSHGASAGAAMGGLPGLLLTGAAVGFSGISVLIQCMSCLSPEGISPIPLLLSRIGAMAVSCGVSAVYYLLRHPISRETEVSVLVQSPDDGILLAAILCIVYTAGRFGEIKHTEKQRKVL